MPLSLEQLAQLCGVSRGSVDRAIHNRPGIREDTRQFILEMARKHNYQPDHVAASLARGRTKCIGVILFDLQNRYFAELFGAIERSAREQGFFVFAGVNNQSPETEAQLLDHMMARRVDGLILTPIGLPEALTERLRSIPVPVVTLGNRISESVHHVGVDDRLAAQDGAELIIRKGYRRIFFVTPPLRHRGEENIFAQEQRMEGFCACAARHPEVEVEILADKTYLRRVLGEIRRGGDKPAFFCSSDFFALEILKAMRQSGYQVPQDAGLMGFDRVDFLDYLSPMLCTVDCRLKEQGAQSVNTLIRLIQGESQSLLTTFPHALECGETL